MKSLIEFARLVIAGIMFGVAAFLLFRLPAIWREGSVLDRLRAARTLERVAVCLEEHRALNGLYPTSLHEIERCLAGTELKPVDPWGQPLRFERYGDKSYSLVSCGSDGRCMGESFKVDDPPAAMGDDLVIQSGHWAGSQSSSDLPNHTLSLSAGEVAVSSKIKVKVATTGDSYGYSLWARVVGDGPWRIGDMTLIAASGEQVLWRESSPEGWDGKVALRDLEVTCPVRMSKLLLAIRDARDLELSIADNFASLTCRSASLPQ